jgi:hypothetical protein
MPYDITDPEFMLDNDEVLLDGDDEIESCDLDCTCIMCFFDDEDDDDIEDDYDEDSFGWFDMGWD